MSGAGGRPALCSADTVRRVAQALRLAPPALSYTSDKVITTVLNNKNVEGFATIILALARQGKSKMSHTEELLCYQWLEFAAMYAEQAVNNQTFAKKFLQEINSALEQNSYLTGQFFTVADITLYHVLYPLLDQLSVLEREAILPVCRWSRHIQARVGADIARAPLPLQTLVLTTQAPAVH